MATTGFTFRSVLGAIATTAHTATNALNAINEGAEMLNTAVTTAATKQRNEIPQDLAVHKLTYAEEKAKELEESRDRIRQWLGNDEQRVERYQTAMSDIDKAIQEMSASRK